MGSHQRQSISIEMNMNLDCFDSVENFYKRLQDLFKSLNIPVNYIDEKLLKPQDILSKTYKDSKPAYQLMDDVYILGMVDESAFKTPLPLLSPLQKGKNYDAILITGKNMNSILMIMMISRV